jgi:hypothetical protein
MYDTLLEIETFFTTDNISEKMKILALHGFSEERIGDFIETTDSYIQMQSVTEIYTTHFALPYWDRLCNLGNIYEEICKEWFLPTYFWSTYNQ